MSNDPSSITKLSKYLPPPFIGLDYVVRNEATGEVGYRWDRGDGKVEYTWEFKDEKAAAKELAKI